uniref:DNA2/NAM7 helicase helicase domain-containing protein n=1 Tax=Fagus sylvatica TaxID=28930 RepID=A0A2N9FSK2_FAGSY
MSESEGAYEPMVGDLIALTDPILAEEQQVNKKRETLYAICLINMTTNIRIWRALKSELEGGNLDIIRNVMQPKAALEIVLACISEQSCSTASADMRSRICSSDLNDSQKDAVLSCLVTRECNHQNSVRLIWGPPGTGKNHDILEVAQRLLKNVTESPEYDTYGLGDIVLFGNGERMKIGDRHDLLDVFLDNRVIILYDCLAQSSGWKGMPENKGKEIDGQSSKDKKSKKNLKKVIVQALNENKNKKTQKEMKEKKVEDKEKEIEEGSSQDKKNQGQADDECDNPLTFEEFVQGRFNCISKRLMYCIENLYTHLPTSFVSLELVKKMIKALDSLKSLETLLCAVSVADKGLLEQVFSKKVGSELAQSRKLRVVKNECLNVLRSLPKNFPVPHFEYEWEIKEFCLQNSCLIFCTVSSSAKLHDVMTSLELLVIDEAAQLKECESTIPLQLPGLRHAILIGDERQLPAMVKSKV